MWIETHTTSSLVSWAAACRAVAFPVDAPGFSQVGMASLMASLLTGVPTNPEPGRLDYLEPLVTGLLALDTDEPVLEFAENLGSGDIARFRRLVMDIMRGAASAEEIAETIAHHNRAMQSYERNEVWLKRIDVLGYLDLVGSLTGKTPPYLSIAMFVWKQLETWLEPALLASHPVLGSVWDSMQALSKLASPNAVLLQRMRRR
jgi:hypothetical protein